MVTPGVRPIRAVRPTAAGLLVLALSVAATLFVMLLGPRADAVFPHDPPGPFLRVPLAIAWAGMQAVSLVAAFTAGPMGFAVACFGMVAGGVGVMSIGRAGITGAASWAPLSVIVPAAIMSVAIGLWLMYRSPEETVAATAWRIFCWLCLTGGVYLFAAHPSESTAHMSAIAASIGICGASAVLAPRISRLIEALNRVMPSRLSILTWVCCVALLVLNGVFVWITGARTPQVHLGVVSVAPYFLVAGLLPFAVALDLGAAATKGWRALVPSAIGLPLAAFLYSGLLHESGTLAVLCVSVLTVVLLAGTPVQALCATGILLIGNFTLRSPWVAEAIAREVPRVGERLLVWSGRQAPPDQLIRVMEVMSFAGVLGHVGAARLKFLVGPQVAKDYMPALVLANGGWVGLAFVGLGSFLFVAELYRASKSTQGVVARAIQTAVLALVVGNLLVTTLWLGGITPFVGVPLPVLARAGSHLMVLAALLLLFDAAAAADIRPPPQASHAR